MLISFSFVNSYDSTIKSASDLTNFKQALVYYLTSTYGISVDVINSVTVTSANGITVSFYLLDTLTPGAPSQATVVSELSTAVASGAVSLSYNPPVSTSRGSFEASSTQRSPSSGASTASIVMAVVFSIVGSLLLLLLILFLLSRSRKNSRLAPSIAPTPKPFMMNNPSYLTIDKRAAYENVNPDGTPMTESESDTQQYGGEHAAPESSQVMAPVQTEVLYDDFNNASVPPPQALIPEASEPAYLSPTIVPTSQHTYINVTPDEVV